MKASREKPSLDRKRSLVALTQMDELKWGVSAVLRVKHLTAGTAV